MSDDSSARREVDDKPPTKRHANRHVAKFLKIPQGITETESPILQICNDGKQLTAERLLNDDEKLNIRVPILVTDCSQSLGMKLPVKKGSKKVTVRDVADLLGFNFPVHVIDVEHQEELEGWSLGDLVDYFEDEARLLQQHRLQTTENCTEANIDIAAGSSSHGSRLRRKAASKCMQLTDQQRPRVLNQISLEFSHTPMIEKVLSPRFVREMDWIDLVWPRERLADGSLARPSAEVYPNVQYYCLTSAGGSYTDFHVDFGGTSVWYHVLSGEKDFCLIPPTKENLAIYEDWLCCPNQAEIFLPDRIPNPETNVLRVSLKESQTLIIPTAWIHGVYTPKDSLVFGGNFLHGADIPLQLAVHCLESRARVPERFRFPHFLPMNFYAGGYYLDNLRRGAVSRQEVDGLGELIDALDEWWKVHKYSQPDLQTGPTVANAAIKSAHFNRCATVEEFLEEFRNEYHRVLKGGISPNPDALKVAPKPDRHLSSSGKTQLRLSIKMITQSDSEGLLNAVRDDGLATTKIGVPKLRLSLKGKTVLQTALVRPKEEMEAPREEVTPSMDNAGLETKPATEFRTDLASTKWTTKVPSKPKRPREATEWIDDGALLEDEWIPPPINTEDEWIPSTSKTGRQSGIAKSTKTRASGKPPTSRQRLMKRLR
jgi:JmjC domain, hydroxylase/Jumonji helical domain